MLVHPNFALSEETYKLDGQFISKWGIKGTGKGESRNPQGIAVDGAGNVYVVDVLSNRVQKFSATHQFVAEWGPIRLYTEVLQQPFRPIGLLLEDGE
jgi:DNA-binding beta-propeller fold protein YncE